MTNSTESISTTPSQRIDWIDVAKGICMISVIAGHLGVKAIDNVVISYHLTLFFILSGYTLKNNFSVENMRKKFSRLMVPYFVTCIAVATMDIINQVVMGNTATRTLTQVLGNDIFRSFAASGAITTLGNVEIGTFIGAIWYLPATFFAVIFVQLLLKYVDRRMYRYVVSIALSIACYLLARITWLPFSILSAFFAAPFVLLGYDFRHRSVPQMLLCFFIFAIGVITRKSQMFYVSADMADLFLSPVCTIAASACIIWIAQKLQKSKVLGWIGRNSIYFLCIHLFELNTMGGVVS